MRFHEKDGWTLPIIESYMKKKGKMHHFDESEMAYSYWVSFPDVVFDCKKLVEDGHTANDYFPSDHVGWTDEEIFKEKQ